MLSHNVIQALSRRISKEQNSIGHIAMRGTGLHHVKRIMQRLLKPSLLSVWKLDASANLASKAYITSHQQLSMFRVKTPCRRRGTNNRSTIFMGTSYNLSLTIRRGIALIATKTRRHNNCSGDEK